MNNEELLARARAVAEHAYAPYSGFRVGAVIVASDGSVYQGVNWENAAYPSGTCAEASAIAAAVTAGRTALQTVAVACIDAGTEAETFPCGQCRQRLYEFGVEPPRGGWARCARRRWAATHRCPPPTRRSRCRFRSE